MNIDWYISQSETEHQALLIEITHNLLMSIIPNCRVQRKYKIPFYTYRMDLCYMNFHRNQPYIAFIQGRLMQDSIHIAKTGKSKYAKYYINEEKDIYSDSFMALILEAITVQDQLYTIKKS